MASIAYLAAATDASTSGLEVGSHTLEFRPRRRPCQLSDRKAVRIEAGSAAASAPLIFQAAFPFLLFAGADGERKGEEEDAIELEIRGGTNVAFSLSWEYLDQVLLPSLQDRFGVVVERRLVRRGWSAGVLPQEKGEDGGGEVWFKFRPIRVGEKLRPRDQGPYQTRDFEVGRVDVSLLAPKGMHEALQNAVVRQLEGLVPGAEVRFEVVEDTGTEARVYVLLVARSETLRWGRDMLTSVPKKKKGKGSGVGDFADYVARKVCRELGEELEGRGAVDEFLQDQLVVFQALAEGSTSFPRSGERGLEEELADLTIGGGRMRKDKAHEPFGEGSEHTRTARWVTAELLRRVGWYNNGRECQGVGMRMEKSAHSVPTGPGT